MTEDELDAFYKKKYGAKEEKSVKDMTVDELDAYEGVFINFFFGGSILNLLRFIFNFFSVLSKK